MTNTTRFLTALLLATPATALAEPLAAELDESAPEAPEVGRRKREHEGFFARLALGPAGMGTAITSDRLDDVEANGNGLSASLQLGASVTESLVLHSDLTVVGTTESLSFKGDDGFDADTIALGALGAGVTYFLPSEWSLSGSVLYALSVLDSTAGEKLDADYGVMLKLGVAKEWKVSDDWGLGLGAALFGGYGHGQDQQDADFDAMYAGAAIHFVTTYN